MQYLIQTLLVLFIALGFAGRGSTAELAAGLAAYERQDYNAALGPLMQLAEAGDSDAQFILGRMFGRGEGVLQDYVEAHKWYNLAASRGQRLAATARDAVAERMTPEQIAAAQQLARDWRPLGRASLSPNTSTVSNPEAITAVQPPATLTTATPVAPTPEPEPEPSIGEELNETLIANIQLELKRLGYPIGTVDGRLGGRTVNAIESYQLHKGLSVTGTASQNLLAHLRSQQGVQPPIRRAPPARVRERPLPVEPE